MDEKIVLGIIDFFNEGFGKDEYVWNLNVPLLWVFGFILGPQLQIDGSVEFGIKFLGKNSVTLCFI